MLPYPFGLLRGRSANYLVQLRMLYVSFVNALLLVGVVVVALASDVGGSGQMSGTTVALGVVAVGAGSLVLQIGIDRPLDCSSAETLMGAYRTRFFLRMACSELGALAGFVGVFLSGSPWVYALGLGFALVGMARAAPTAARLRHDQEQLSRRGCGLDLVALLTGGAEAS
jgi:hypothetical protein